MNRKSIDRIESIIGDRALALAIGEAISRALGSPFVHLNGDSVWDVFELSLRTAIRQVEGDRRYYLLRRLIEYGPQNPDEPDTSVSDGETILSDPECGSCVQYIFSHMVNQFKGELAQLLALPPCISLVQQLKQSGRLPPLIRLYWGDIIKERRRKDISPHKIWWGSFAKGADGLLAETISIQDDKPHKVLRIHGVIEIKSMSPSKRQLLEQIDKHVIRLKGGVRLGEKTWPPSYVEIRSLANILVRTSTWKLSRKWHSIKTENGRAIVFPDTAPQDETQTEKLQRNLWRITLAWSKEALEQAAYEMTRWYMAQLGADIYNKKPLPKGWEHMTPEQAGDNAIKQNLYYLQLRPFVTKPPDIATKVYNIYCFGYAQDAESKEPDRTDPKKKRRRMLWPEDFPDKEKL